VAASALKELLTSEPALPLALDASTREVSHEVGNIVLNACLGTFGNLLHMQIGFSVPDHQRRHREGACSTRWSRAGRFPLCAGRHRRIPAARRRSHGYVVIVLSVQSLNRLLGAVDDWERRQHLM
jgi:chemotaxis protein CheC